MLRAGLLFAARARSHICVPVVSPSALSVGCRALSARGDADASGDGTPVEEDLTRVATAGPTRERARPAGSWRAPRRAEITSSAAAAPTVEGEGSAASSDRRRGAAPSRGKGARVSATAPPLGLDHSDALLGASSVVEDDLEADDDEAVDAEVEARSGAAADRDRLLAFLEARSAAAAAGVGGDTLAGDVGLSPAAAAALSAGPAAAHDGLTVDYCIFCYHGTSMLRVDNGALMTKFITERGFLLPKRFSKCCAKHQRKLARTVRRARCMNLLPWHSKLHPRLRFTSMFPEEPSEAAEGAATASAPAPPGAAPAARKAASSATPPAATTSGRTGLDAALAEIAARSLERISRGTRA